MELSNKKSINNDNSLCLYCDKTFSNNVDQENHVERDHKTILCKGKGSRKSERITKNNSSSENSPFPGCFHCNKRPSRTDDLDVLFKHLLMSHKDIYFGCKCKIRAQDKFSLASHKKNCKIGDGGRSARCSDENVTDGRKATKKSQIMKNNGDSRCDSLSESEDNASSAAATLPTNAIHKKSDRSKLKNLSKSSSVNEKMRNNKNSSSSSTTSSSGSSIKTGDDEYTIPLTRQKLKEPPIFSRLGATQNRNIGSNKKTQKTNKTATAIEIKNITSASLATKVTRTKANKVVNTISHNNSEPIENVQKSEIINIEFDEDFYKNISSNIRINLNCYVDGKSDRLLNRPVFDHIAEQSVSCSIDKKQDAIIAHEKEIYEATNFELSTPFPALLTVEQYGFGDSNPNKHKRQITKNSWKWKWDLIKKFKYVNEGGKIVKKVKQITTGLKDLSQLDMWTQLSMRSRYENLNTQNGSKVAFDDVLKESLSSRIIKTQNIEQLNCILDKRLTPEIDIEQLQQTVIKLEPEEKEEMGVSFGIGTDVNETEGTESELLNMFNLVKTSITNPSKPLLSGEWARPRCYICIDCGQKFDLMKSLNDHKNSEHPYVVSAHYEIVGRENLEQKLYKNLFLPKKALQTSGFARSLSVNSDSKSNETNEASTSSDNSSKFFADQKEIECSKCLKMVKYSSDNDIYRHILDCVEDRTWMQAKRRSKYRRSRRRNRKNTRKLRLSIDQKKITSSPSTKDNTEGENSTLSLSNPSTPKTDIKTSTVALPIKTNKIEPLIVINKAETVNGKSNDGMNIKNFFRVSKMTPALTQKVVVQMMEMPPSNQTNSLRSSLRSSSAKRAASREVIPKNGSVSKNEIPKMDDKKEKLVRENDFKSCSEESKILDVKVNEMVHQTLDEVKPISQSFEGPLIPLLITTLDKTMNDFSPTSPSNASLISPTSNSNVPKKKKKLNDCIAMLTCKIQEKLGVNFFEIPQVASELLEETRPNDSDSNLQQEPKIMESKPSTSFQIASLLKESTYTLPVQDEVIDLSIKKKLANVESPKFEKLESGDSPIEDTKVAQKISENISSPKEHEPVTVGTSIVSILCESQLEAADSIMLYDGKPLPSCLKNEEPIIQEESFKSQEFTETKIEMDEEPKEIEKVDANCAESFKISISKERLPNLTEILDQYQIITVNNIKISESERRAFEEQKTRILQILNKTNSLTRKFTSKKTTQKKAVKRKAPVRKLTTRRNVSKKSEVAKSKADVNVFAAEAEIVDAQIEEVIKTTNRIRCRRLSVVVDPIINLTAFQNKNRKIRLTNNSQQNGFYEMLVASEQFFSTTKSSDGAPKVEMIVKPSRFDDTKSEAGNNTLKVQESKIVEPGTKEVIEKVKLVTKSRAAKSNAKETKNILTITSKEVEAKNLEPVQQSIKSKTKTAEKKTVIKPAKVTNFEEEKILESLVETSRDSTKSTPRRLKAQKQQNVENIATPALIVEPLVKASVACEKKFEICIEIKSEERPKATLEKPHAKNFKKFFSPLEEIKVGQSVKDANVKEMLERKKKMTKCKQQANEVNLLDISFSSDTSNENNIPLAKLIIPRVEPFSIEMPSVEADVKKLEEPDKVLKEKELKVIIPKSRTSVKVLDKLEPQIEKLIIENLPKVDKFMKILTTETYVNKADCENQITPVGTFDKKIDREIETSKIIETIKPEVQEGEPIKKLQPLLCKTSSTIDLSSMSDVDTKKSFDAFTINEDSFFNDDLDNDPSDKINDIVNNIINSSEFQIDSDTEKSEVYQPNDDQSADKNQTACCTICKRTFRKVKVLEKHCLSSTHIMKVQRRHRGIARTQERLAVKPDNELGSIVVKEKASSPIFDEAKVFRTKGALKTFDTISDVPVAIDNQKTTVDEEMNVDKIAQPQQELSREQKLLNANEDKLYYEFKMEKKPEDMTPKDKDQLFDSLFNSLEAKAQEKQISFLPISNYSVATPQDSEMESSTASWDLKHDVEWEVENPENVPFANAIKEKYPKKYPVKINKSRDTAVSIPTKSLIMGKIFKKHRDREKQNTPQADAPNNKPGIKNSLDEIFDHLKNSAEIDDKVLTCPSPKTLLKTVSGTFLPHSPNSNDMLETASQSNNIYVSETDRTIPEQDDKKAKADSKLLLDSLAEYGDDGIGKRKSRRRCAIKAKTFAETWSSDEYEELHDTADIIDIINEIEKRELKKRKSLKGENHLECNTKGDTGDISVKIDTNPCSTVKVFESSLEKKSVQTFKLLSCEKFEKKKSVQIQFVDDSPKPEKTSNSIKKRRMSAAKDSHKSDDETFTATKEFKPLRPCPSIRKRRMSCFVPSTTSFDDKPKSKPTVVAKLIKEPLRIESETLRNFEKANENQELKTKSVSVKKAYSEKSFRNQKKFLSLSNYGSQQLTKKKVQKHRKRPRNKVKNIAYDSDSDFELNLNKKSKPSTFSGNSSLEEEQEEDSDDDILAAKTSKSQTMNNASRSSITNDMTMIKESKLLPNDLKHLVESTTTFEAAIPEDILDSSQSACNRTKRHSSEKLYYWSSSSSESDQEQGNTADGDNEDSVVPHQPEQHGWIVGDSHKKLVTLLAHAKIKNKIN